MFKCIQIFVRYPEDTLDYVIALKVAYNGLSVGDRSEIISVFGELRY